MLADYRALVVDEAHKLPEAARQMFGKNLCMDDIREIAYYLEREHQNVEARTLKTGMYSIFTNYQGKSHVFPWYKGKFSVDRRMRILFMGGNPDD